MKSSQPKPKAKKALGQNFLINPGIAPKMIEESGLTEEYGVLEIGPGLGALTKELCPSAKKVVAIELDKDVIPELTATLAPYDNYEIIMGDVMELDLREIIETRFAGMPVAVFGNLPYYITSPIIMRLLEERLPVEFITVMVQKEAARRLAAPEGTRDAGAVTLAVHYYSDPKVLFDVSPGSFYPAPKVTSSVLTLRVKGEAPVRPKDEKRFFETIKAAFSQRRKTVLNSVAAGLGMDKALVASAMERAGVDPGARAETLKLSDFAALSDEIFGL